MTLSDILEAARFRLGNKTNLDNHIAREVRLAQRALETDPKLNLWFLFRSFTFQSYLTERAYPLPNDFVKMSEMYQPYFLNEQNLVSSLKRKPTNLVFRPTTLGVPEYYGLEAQMFITDKDAEGVYRIFYYASDVDLHQGQVEENNWTRISPLILMLRAVMNVAKTTRDMDLFSLTKAEYDVEYKNLHDMCVAQEDVGYDLSRGDFN